MNKAFSQHAPCAICKSQPADKPNSHIIPSFFVAMVSSIDNSYKRDKELLYTIGDRITTAYIGHAVREEELDKTEHVPPLKTVKSVQFWS